MTKPLLSRDRRQDDNVARKRLLEDVFEGAGLPDGSRFHYQTMSRFDIEIPTASRQDRLTAYTAISAALTSARITHKRLPNTDYTENRAGYMVCIELLDLESPYDLDV